MRLWLAVMAACWLCLAPVRAGEDEKAASKVVLPSEDFTGEVVILEVKQVIASKTKETFKHAFARFAEEPPKLVVIEIDTYGGYVDACDKISHLLLSSEAPTRALVLRKGISGGAMIATACAEIFMVRGSRIGDVQPMPAMPGQELDARTVEKIEADVRAIMRSNANAHGHPAQLLAAMVSRDMEVIEVVFKDGSREFLNRQNFDLLEKSIEEGRDKRGIETTRGVVDKGKLLHLDALEALDLGLAEKVVPSREAFYREQDIDLSEAIVLTPPEETIEFPQIFGDFDMELWKSMLLVIFLIMGFAGAFTEAHMPGFGIPGAVGIIGFACFFAILAFDERLEAYQLVLFIVGVILLVIEIVVIPGFGVAGILGIVCLLSGLILAMLPAMNTLYWRENYWQELGTVGSILLIAILLTVVCIAMLMRLAPRLPFLHELTDSGVLPSGRQSLERGRITPAMDDDYNPSPLDRYRGARGVSVTCLRPAGKVKLDSGEAIDVVSTGDLIEKDTRVKVERTDMNRIIVVPDNETNA